MSTPITRNRAGVSNRTMQDRNARLRKADRVRRNAAKRATLKQVSWNVNNYTPRAPNVEALFAHEEIDVLFVCETKQQRWPSGSVKPLDFDGSIIAMSAHAKTRGRRQGISMGIAFISKRPGLLRRDGAYRSTRNK